MSEASHAQRTQATEIQSTQTTASYTYAIGDIHGAVAPLQQLMAELPLRSQDTLVFLGDYMDRGPDSVGAVRILQQIQQQHPRSVFLRGNHDDSWLEFWDARKKRFTRSPYMPGARHIWNFWKGRVPSDVGEWLSQTKIDYEDQYAYYVHAGLTPHMTPAETDTFIKLWGDADFLKTSYRWPKPVVFGHYQLNEPILEENKIGLDTGAYQTGILTAIRLPDRKLFQSSVAPGSIR